MACNNLQWASSVPVWQCHIPRWFHNYHLAAISGVLIIFASGGTTWSGLFAAGTASTTTWSEPATDSAVDTHHAPVQSLLFGSTPTARSSFAPHETITLLWIHLHANDSPYAPDSSTLSSERSMAPTIWWVCPAGFVCSPMAILIYAWDVSFPFLLIIVSWSVHGLTSY